MIRIPQTLLQPKCTGGRPHRPRRTSRLRRAGVSSTRHWMVQQTRFPLLFRVNGQPVTTHDPAEVEVSFGADRYGAEEGGDPATVEVSLGRAPSAPVTIPLRIVSRNGGAVPGDHSPVPAGVTFAAGQTEASFTVRAVDDNLDDDFESLTLGFGNLPAGYHAGRGTTSVALLDNDGDAALVSNLMQDPPNTRDCRQGCSALAGFGPGFRDRRTPVRLPAHRRRHPPVRLATAVRPRAAQGVAGLGIAPGLGRGSGRTHRPGRRTEERRQPGHRRRLPLHGPARHLSRRLHPYWIVMEGLGDLGTRSAAWQFTFRDGEDPGTAPGWSIGDYTGVLTR